MPLTIGPPQWLAMNRLIRIARAVPDMAAIVHCTMTIELRSNKVENSAHHPLVERVRLIGHLGLRGSESAAA